MDFFSLQTFKKHSKCVHIPILVQQILCFNSTSCHDGRINHFWSACDSLLFLQCVPLIVILEINFPVAIGTLQHARLFRRFLSIPISSCTHLFQACFLLKSLSHNAASKFIQMPLRQRWKIYIQIHRIKSNFSPIQSHSYLFIYCCL